MNRLKNFFLFCSGIDLAILEKCKSDENKYIGIGATVFFTGILAFCSAGYALYTVFDSWLAATAFGLIWGVMIFNLDRYIVSSMKSNGSFWRDLMVAFPRLIMAVLLALVISKPLELKIFEKEINAELLVMEQEVFKSQEDRVKERYTLQIADAAAQIATWKNELARQEAARDTLMMMSLQEADGTGGSGKKNLGPIYRAKKQKADLAQAELEAMQAAYLPLIAEKQAAINNMEATIQGEIASLDRQQYGGIAARMEALDRLAQRSEAIFLANIFIMLLFISIETAPIFVKLISYRSPYDYLLHEHEHVFQMVNLERTTLLQNAVKNKLEVDTQVGTYRSAAQVTAEKALIDEKLKQRLAAMKTQQLDWDQGLMNTPG